MAQIDKHNYYYTNSNSIYCSNKNIQNQCNVFTFKIKWIIESNTNKKIEKYLNVVIKSNSHEIK
jgi:hypothetical protein